MGGIGSVSFGFGETLFLMPIEMIVALIIVLVIVRRHRAKGARETERTSFSERMAWFVRFLTAAGAYNAVMLVLSVSQIAPRVFGPLGAIIVWGSVLNLALLGAGVGLLRLLRRRSSRM